MFKIFISIFHIFFFTDWLKNFVFQIKPKLIFWEGIQNALFSFFFTRRCKNFNTPGRRSYLSSHNLELRQKTFSSKYVQYPKDPILGWLRVSIVFPIGQGNHTILVVCTNHHWNHPGISFLLLEQHFPLNFQIKIVYNFLNRLGCYICVIRYGNCYVLHISLRSSCRSTVLCLE